MDTSYKSDFYSADLLEHVQQQYKVPEERVVGLTQNQQLYKSVESVSVVADCSKWLSSWLSEGHASAHSWITHKQF